MEWDECQHQFARLDFYRGIASDDELNAKWARLYRVLPKISRLRDYGGASDNAKGNFLESLVGTIFCCADGGTALGRADAGTIEVVPQENYEKLAGLWPLLRRLGVRGPEPQPGGASQPAASEEKKLPLPPGGSVSYRASADESAATRLGVARNALHLGMMSGVWANILTWYGERLEGQQGDVTSDNVFQHMQKIIFKKVKRPLPSDLWSPGASQPGENDGTGRTQEMVVSKELSLIHI